MASIQLHSADKNAALVVAHLHLFMHDEFGEDVHVSNIRDGYRISNWSDDRSVEITGHKILQGKVLCQWKSCTPFDKNVWDEDCTTHDVKQAHDLAEVIVSFVSRNSWPAHCERHRVTNCPS